MAEGKVKVGARVKVFSADRSQYLGLGTIKGFEKVSFEDKFVTDVPVIELDSGEVLRGYECWWILKEEADKAEIEVFGRVVFE